FGMPESRNSHHSRSFPLSMASEGEALKIVTLLGGRGLSKRLASMGLSVNSLLEIVNRQGNSIVIARSETRLAIGSGMAHKILVEPA
ncbi:MAG: FeoA family protein, partial [Methylococcales bacterium]